MRMLLQAVRARRPPSVARRPASSRASPAPPNSIRRHTMKRNANPAATVAAWNSAYPVGTEVDYRFHRTAAPKRTRTTTEAQVLGGHTAVVWLAGVSGCVALSHCEPA